MAQDDFVVKLPVGMEISGEAVGDLTHQLNSLDSKLPSVTIKVKSDGAKKVTDEINSLVAALKESGRTDFKVNLLGNRNGDIRKAVVEYTELSDGISRVIQQQYNLRDVVEKGELIRQFWEEGSKGVVKFTQGQDEAKAKTEATKKAMAELASEIAAVNKALSQSELEFARGNQNVSNLHFDDVAEKELRTQQKILALEKEGVITYEQAAEKLYELDEAIISAGEKADIFNAKIADKQYNQDFKKALTEQNEEQKRIAEEIARSERLAVAYREASWRDNIAKREAEEKRAAEERIAEEKRIAEEEKRISDEKIRNDRLNASNYEAIWKEALAERETEEKRISDEQERRERLNAVYREARWKDNLAEREAEEKRIAEEQAYIENERFKNQRLSASNYESWWAQALSERDSLEKRIAEEQANRERRNASNYVNWWTQALNEVDAKREADDLSSEMTSWLSSDSRLSNSAYFSSEIEKLVDGLKKGDITADQARQSLSKLKDEAKKLGVAGKTMGKQVVDALKDIANIATVAEAVRMLYNATKQVIGNVRELDDVMVDLQIASGASANEVERMMDAYHALAKEIGATSVEVAQAADGWLRQGYSAAEATELIRSSTMLAKLGQMEAAEATNALTSAMKGYQYGVEEAEHIVDKFAATDMNAAVSAGYLATAMSKTAVGAKEMGIDFDALTGYIATVGEVTQDSAESVGTFFKTLIARMGNIKAGNLVDPETAESLSDAESVLNSLGIKLRDGNENFRSFKAVLDDVHNSWEDYNDVQRQSIAVAFAGTRNQEKFKVLMANYADAVKLAGISADSAGTAMEKYNAYMDSITASVEKFKASVYDFSDTLINSGLIKGVVDFGSAIVNSVTAVMDFAGTIPALATAFGLIKGISAVSKIYNLSKAFLELGDEITDVKDKAEVLRELFPKLSKKQVEATVAAFEGSAANDALGKTYKVLGARISDAWKSLTKFVAANGAMIASFAAPIALIWGLVAAQKAQEEQTRKTREAYIEAKSASEEIQEKLDKERELLDELNKEQERLFDNSRQGQIDEQERVVEGLEKEYEYLERIEEIRRDASNDEAKDSLENYAKWDLGTSDDRRVRRTEGAENVLNNALSEIEKLSAEYKKIQNLIATDPDVATDDFSSRLAEDIKKDLDELILSYDAAVTDIREIVKGLNPDSKEYEFYTQLLEMYEKVVAAAYDTSGSGINSHGFGGGGKYFGDVAEGVEKLAETFGNLKAIVDANNESLSSLNDQIDTALDWRSSAEQVQAAIDKIKELTGIDLNIDADGMIETLQLMKGYIDGDGEAFEELAEKAIKSLGIKPNASGIKNVIESLLEDFSTLEGAARTTAIAILKLFESIGAISLNEKYDSRIYSAIANGYSNIGDVFGISDSWLEGFSDRKSSSSSGSKTDAYLENYKKLVAELDHLRAMDYISEEEYYRRLQALADKYLKGKSKYLDEYRSVQEKLWAYQKELYEKQRDAEIEAAENRADAQKKALEDQYDAEKEALEKRKDLLEDEKDAYKDLIDYKKDLLDDASDERAHDQRVTELNQDIAQIEAELAALALDNSAKANARRVELHDELMAKQKELEDEQWDWSVDNQKDALDKEYERYEKTIDAQIKLLEDQLDALEKSYDAQLDHIDSMLEANINAINSSFDALINRAADAAAQIQAIFASIDVSTSSGITGLQQGLVNSGYDIGNYGANKDGVDGVMGKMTTKGLQQYLNDLQNSGVINFGDDLKVDGKVGSKTRKAIDAAIAAGYLNASFDKLHTGGIVGQKSSRNDLDIIKELVPLNDNEVWAKLLKKEMVLTEGQQEAVREAFRSIAAIKSATNTDVSKSRTLAGSVVQNNSPVFTIHNVFEGDVDADTLRRLDEWGNKFKKDVQNGVFKTMNQQNKFAGKTPVKTI